METYVHFGGHWFGIRGQICPQRLFEGLSCLRGYQKGSHQTNNMHMDMLVIEVTDIKFQARFGLRGSQAAHSIVQLPSSSIFYYNFATTNVESMHLNVKVAWARRHPRRGKGGMVTGEPRPRTTGV